MYMVRFAAALALATFLVINPAGAQHKHRAHDTKSLDVTAAWARASATPKGASAAYVSIKNMGDAGDRLIGARTSVAKRAMLHTHVMEGGIAKMRHIEAVDVPAGADVAMAPGGNHVMLMGLETPLKEGDHFPLTLVFENAGEITVSVDVLSVTAEGPMPMQHDHAQGHEHGDGHGNMPHGRDSGHGSMKASIPERPADLDLRTRKMSAHGMYDISLVSQVDPVVINEMHSWVVEIKTPDGQSVTGAKVAIDGGMPAHGHGLPTAPRVTKELGGGKYLVEGMQFNMGGWWELKLQIDGSHADDVTFNVMLKGQ